MHNKVQNKIKKYTSLCGPYEIPNISCPVTLSACIPSSPLKKITKIRVKAVTNSQKPNDIIANAVPILLVDK